MNKTKNVVSEEVNIFEDKSSLNDSTEFFLEKLESTNKDCKKLCDDNQTGEVIVPFNGETDNDENILKAQSNCTNASASTVVLQTKLIQCPLCLKKVEKYVSHIKMCAARRKLTPQQLMLALELQKRQAEERLALGLPLLPEKLPVTRKTRNNRVSMFL